MTQDLNNASLEVQLEAVRRDGGAIQFINSPSLEVQLEAVRQNGHAIYYIESPCLEVQLEAAKTIPGDFAKYITHPEARRILEARLLVEDVLVA